MFSFQILKLSFAWSQPKNKRASVNSVVLCALCVTGLGKNKTEEGSYTEETEGAEREFLVELVGFWAGLTGLTGWVGFKKKKVTQRAQRGTEFTEAGKTLLVFRRTDGFLFKPFEQKGTKIIKTCFLFKS